MTIFQKIANWIRSITTPAWLKEIGDICDGVVRAAIIELGKDVVGLLQVKIIEVAKNGSLNTEQKFKAVFSYARTIGVEIRDSILTILINALVYALKQKGVIK